MFDINYYNEKFKENLGSIGGSTPSEGMSNWELWGSAKGTNEISLPTDYEELKVVTQFVSGNDTLTFTQTITKEMIENATSNIVQISNSGYSSSGVSLALWFIYKDTNKILLSASSTYTHASYTTTYLYYKKKNGITVNLGTESNWALWGEVTGTTQIALPSEWEEIKVELIQTTLIIPNTTINPRLTIDITKDMIVNNTQAYYLPLASNNSNSHASIKITNNKINIASFIYNGADKISDCSLKVYYKKKCDNVLDINDLGEWKLWTSIAKGGSYSFSTFPTECKEILIVGILSTNKKATTSLCFPEYLENLAKVGTTSSKSFYYMPYNSTQSISLYTNGGQYCIGGSEDLDVKIYYR